MRRIEQSESLLETYHSPIFFVNPDIQLQTLPLILLLTIVTNIPISLPYMLHHF